MRSKLFFVGSALLFSIAACGDNIVPEGGRQNPDPPDDASPPGCEPCHADAACDASGPAPVCVCNPGFSGDGTVAGTGCTDINECELNVCGNFACENDQGGYTCLARVAMSPFTNSAAVLSDSGSTLDAIVIRHAEKGVTYTGTISRALDPTDGTEYYIVKTSVGRELGRIDTSTFVFTRIAVLSTNFSSLAFDATGQLWGVTGDGATPSETLYKIDKATGAETLHAQLGNGADGEVIAYHPTENVLYHWSGNGTVVMETVSLDAVPVITPVSGGLGTGEVFAAQWSEADGQFVIVDINSRIQLLTPAGVASSPQSTDDDWRVLLLNQPIPWSHSAAPAAGPETTEVVLKGRGLTDATRVAFGGIDATSFTVVDDETILAIVPPGLNGTVDILAETPAAYDHRWPQAFTYVAPSP